MTNLPAENTVAVVAIGASAGGLVALQELFGALPIDTGCAFVVVQHLDASRPSLLPEILARATGMKVCEAADGMVVERNRVYVMPAHADLVFAAGSLQLPSRTPVPGSQHLPIDRCLRSLSHEFGSRAIAVILSGTGADGADGVAQVKASGGMTFAQEPSTAGSASMPRAAIESGQVDFVLPPREIATELQRLSRHPALSGALPTDGQTAANAQHAILAALLQATGIDFSQYRETTVKRRIARRLMLRGVQSLPEYAASLAGDPEELHQLQQDLLIGVTRFFRDPGSFAAMTALVWPDLLRDRAPGKPIRIWVPGCATGEEALSIAICLDEYLTTAGASHQVQVYASDINLEAIHTARTGCYPAKIAVDVGPERLARYFTPADDGYRVVKQIREQCVYTQHNLLVDPPFSKLDLISCRNVLMYLPGVQQRVLRLFHYALKPKGVLIVGSAETASFDDLFALVDRANGIHSRRESQRRLLPYLNARPGGTVPVERAVESLAGDGDNLRKRVDRYLLGRFGPAVVVVGHDLQVLEVRGAAREYLALPDGPLNFHLLSLVQEAGLYLHVERMVREALRGGAPVRQERVLYAIGSGMREVTLEAIPLAGRGDSAVLVLFAPVAASPASVAATTEVLPVTAGDDARDHQIARLSGELQEAHRRFIGLIEEHEAARASIQDVTEEALSTNEELRSVNEELETAKEELQCANEELTTLNAELQAKNQALASARDQALSIVAAVGHPLLVVDRSLRVVSANDAYLRTFGTTTAACERCPLAQLGHGLWDVPAMHALLAELTAGRLAPDAFELECDVPDVGKKIVAIRGSHISNFDLLLLSIEDLTPRRASEAALAQVMERLRETEKMEAVGRLAGGVAHDFNNLLTVIHGYSVLLRTQLANDSSALETIDIIQAASERASALTRQLLAFGRRQVLQPRVIDLNSIIADFDKLLRRVVGESIEVVVDAAPELWRVWVDPGEIGRVMMNLALNARAAMLLGGTLTIQTANTVLTAAEATELGLEPGRCVRMVVADTGVGMSATTLSHVFEPFFTTKEVGEGSGLGLATILGIVEQSGGSVRCESELGAGTKFRIWLPAFDDVSAEPAPEPVTTIVAPGGSPVVLLVEDEAVVRWLIHDVLVRDGYTVLEAGNGLEALDLGNSHPGPIHLLLTDLVMPQMGGMELSEALCQSRPELRVLFMSGYAADDRARTGIRTKVAFLQKPFAPADVVQAVRAALAAAVDPPAA